MDVPQTHTCEWRDEAERLRGEVSGLQQQLAALAGNLQSLQRAVFGKRSEKMPPIGKQLRGDKPASPEEALKKRRANKAARAAMPEREVHHAVPAEDKVCLLDVNYGSPLTTTTLPHRLSSVTAVSS